MMKTDSIYGSCKKGWHDGQTTFSTYKSLEEAFPLQVRYLSSREATSSCHDDANQRPTEQALVVVALGGGEGE